MSDGKATAETEPQVLGLVERLALGLAPPGRSGRALGTIAELKNDVCESFVDRELDQ